MILNIKTAETGFELLEISALVKISATRHRREEACGSTKPPLRLTTPPPLSRKLRHAPGRRRGRALRRRLELRAMPSRRAPLRDGDKINVRSLAILTRNALFPVEDIAGRIYGLKEDIFNCRQKISSIALRNEKKTSNGGGD